MKQAWFISLGLLAAATAQADALTVLQQIDRHSPYLQSQALKAQAAESAAKAVEAKRLGQLSIYGRANRFNDDRLIRPMTSGNLPIRKSYFDEGQYAYGVQYATPLDLNGQISLKASALQAQARSEQASAEASRLELLYKGLALYRTLQKLYGDKAAIEAQQKALVEHHGIAVAGEKTGRIAHLDVLKIATEQASVVGKLQALQAQIDATRAQLAGLMGVARYDETVSPPQQRPPVLQLRSGAVEQRPDIQALQAQQAAGENMARATARALTPAVKLFGQLEHVEGFEHKGDALWQIGLRADWTLWDFHATDASTHEWKQKSAAAQLGAQHARNVALAALKAAQARYAASEARFNAAKLGLQTARETAHIQRIAYQAGRSSAVSLLDTETQLARARAEYTDALTAWWQAWDAAQQALGNDPVTLLAEQPGTP